MLGRPVLRLRLAAAFGLAAACAGVTAMATAGVAAAAPAAPVAPADSVRDGQLWALNMMDVPAAWDAGNEGQGVTVAVLDSGVAPGVSDLDGSVVSGPDLTGVSTPPGSPDWGQHGTWMASVIAGHGHGVDDDDGILGAAPKAKILSVRVIPDRNDPGYTTYEREQESRVQDSLAKGIRYAVDHGADVISMSIGYSSPSASVRSALQYAYGHGVAVVASSGNSGDTSSASKNGYAPLKFPADYPGVIGVAAVSSAGSVAGFSSDNLSVEVAAPGVNISAQGRDGQYWLVTGTSPACALVAGVAALIKAKYPGLAPDLLAKALTSTTHYRPGGRLRPEGRLRHGQRVRRPDRRRRAGPPARRPDRHRGQHQLRRWPIRGPRQPRRPARHRPADPVRCAGPHRAGLGGRVRQPPRRPEATPPPHPDRGLSPGAGLLLRPPAPHLGPAPHISPPHVAPARPSPRPPPLDGVPAAPAAPATPAQPPRPTPPRCPSHPPPHADQPGLTRSPYPTRLRRPARSRCPRSNGGHRAGGHRRKPMTDQDTEGSPAQLDDFASDVLDVVDAIPPGQVMSYGDIAEFLGRGGPRQVGRVMSTSGGGVPWWRVVHANGSLLAGHERTALREYRKEGTPLRASADGSSFRVDMRRARWHGPEAPEPGNPRPSTQP